MPRQIDVTGQRFGRLFVVCKVANINQRSAYLCRCDCGNEKVIPLAYFRHGQVKSCGCLRVEQAILTAQNQKRKNTMRNNPLYHRWASMIQRCENFKNPHYKNYGARGITVCHRWRTSFDSFMTDMGEPETQYHTIERIDNSGPYAPENCRWATRHEQLRNRRVNIILNIDGERLAIIDWAKRAGIDYQRVTRLFRKHGLKAVETMIRDTLR